MALARFLILVACLACIVLGNSGSSNGVSGSSQSSSGYAYGSGTQPSLSSLYATTLTPPTFTNNFPIVGSAPNTSFAATSSYLGNGQQGTVMIVAGLADGISSATSMGNAIGISTSSDGVTFSSFTPIVASLNGNAQLGSPPAIGVGNVVWGVVYGTNKNAVWYTRSTTNGKTWTTPTQLVYPNNTKAALGSPAVATDNHGVWVVVLTYNSAVCIATSTNNMQSFPANMWNLPDTTNSAQFTPVVGSAGPGAPAAANVQGGTLMVAMEILNVATGVVQIGFTKSTNSGKSWSIVELIPYNVGTGVVSNPTLTAGAAGQWLLAANLNSGSSTSQTSMVIYTYSTDDGKTWSPWANVDPQEGAGWNVGNAWSTYVVPGTGVPAYFAMVVEATKGNGVNNIFYTESFDGGFSWTLPNQVASMNSLSFPGLNPVVTRALGTGITVIYSDSQSDIYTAHGLVPLPKTRCQATSSCLECTLTTNCEWCPTEVMSNIYNAPSNGSCIDAVQARNGVVTCSAGLVNSANNGLCPNTSGSTPKRHKWWVPVLIILGLGFGFAIGLFVALKVTGTNTVGELFGRGTRSGYGSLNA